MNKQILSVLVGANLLAMPIVDLTIPTFNSQMVVSAEVMQEAPQIQYIPANLNGQPAVQLQVMGDLPANTLITFVDESLNDEYTINGNGQVVTVLSPDESEVLTLEFIPTIQNIIMGDDGTEITADRLAIERYATSGVDGQMLYLNNELGAAFDQELMLTLIDDQEEMHEVIVPASAGEVQLDLPAGEYIIASAVSPGAVVHIEYDEPIVIGESEDADITPIQTDSNSEADTSDTIELGAMVVDVIDTATQEPVADVTVRISDDDDQMVTDITDEFGEVSFDELTPGEYWVEVLDMPEGYHFAQQDGVEVYGQSTTVIEGQAANVQLLVSSEDEESTQAPTAELGSADIVVKDTVTDQPVSGVSVRMQDVNQQMVTLTTDQTGAVHFDDVEPGDYSFEVFDLPAGYDFAMVDGQEDFMVDGEVVAGEMLERTLYVTGQESSSSIEEQVGTARVVVYDAATEAPISQVSIRAIDADDQMITIATDEEGVAIFDQLAPGDYFFELYDLPEGYHFTQEDGKEVTGANAHIKENAQTNVQLYLDAQGKAVTKEKGSLPETGERQPILWTVGGLLVAAAGIGLIAYRRNKQ